MLRALFHIGGARPPPSPRRGSSLCGSIKTRRGLLEIDGDLENSIRASHFSILTITDSHGWAAGLLPQHHADPFDRMLVAQGQIESMVIATIDKVFDLYDVATI